MKTTGATFTGTIECRTRNKEKIFIIHSSNGTYTARANTVFREEVLKLGSGFETV